MSEAGYTVRRAQLDDHGAMAPLFERFYREEGFDSAVGRLSANLRDVLRRPDTAAFVAETPARAIGVAAMSTSFGLEVGLYAELEDIYVVPDWRSRGVASALVEAGVTWARARGCHDVEIVLTPHAQGRAGLAEWYAGRGFRDTGRRIWEREIGNAT